ncbi:hypothetical protein BV898_08745 [Hypsibius exemplaris]|uniref:Uncharacterized protein n=1 Tax=Hypsibius exemplaris TaxID=2072580 RepID=A0A1W0WPN0_HYPEX|nr:hypothetical protein BV898_08745 [Hypsibius exemplaris]
MADRKSVSTKAKEDEAGWSLVDADGDVESVSSDSSSSADFLTDRPQIASAANMGARVAPIADYHDLVMVDLPGADSLNSTLVNLDSDEDVVHVNENEEETDDNLDDWVTHEAAELIRRRSAERLNSLSNAPVPKREDDESSECSSATSSDSSSWAGESLHEIAEPLDPEDQLPLDEELPADYPQAYRPTAHVYSHQRNPEADKYLTLVLVVALTIVSAVAFGHFRGTTVATRHSHFAGAAFESPSPPSSTDGILSGIQKDQIEILRQLQQLLHIQVELKSRIASLEDENKDLRLRLLESRKKCTRILHKSASPASPSTNASDDKYDDAPAVTEAPPKTTQSIFDFHPEPAKRKSSLALPLSLSAIVQAEAAAEAAIESAIKAEAEAASEAALQPIRTNFRPLDATEAAQQPIRTNFRPLEAVAPLAGTMKSPYVDTRVESLRQKRSAFAAPDRFQRVPKEPVDFVMIEDVMVPLEKLLGAPKSEVHRFAPPPAPVVEPKSRSVESDSNMDIDELEDPEPEEEGHSDATDRYPPGYWDRRGLWDGTKFLTLNLSELVPLREEVARARETIPRVLQSLRKDVLEVYEALRNSSEDLLEEAVVSVAPVAEFMTGVVQAALDNGLGTPRSIKVERSDYIKEKMAHVKADIRREKERIEKSHKKIRESSAWKNTSVRGDKKLEKAERQQQQQDQQKSSNHRTKYSAESGCESGHRSADGYCFLKPNKYRKPDTQDDCRKGKRFWSGLPAFIKRHLGHTKRLEKMVMDLGVDIVHSKVFKKVMQEVPKKFKISSDWLDCQWSWWRNFGRGESLASYKACAGYLTSWQHKASSDSASWQHKASSDSASGFSRKNSRQDKELEDERSDQGREQKGSQEAEERIPAQDAVNDTVAAEYPTWVFQRASDRAELRERLFSAGRNLTSWFFQRAKSREEQRSRYIRDIDYSDPVYTRPRSRRVPSDPIYEFLRHRAAFRRSADYGV